MANASNGTTSNSIAPEDIIKILVATDIHLGYAEKHPIKADDSFVTFEEILKMGVDEGVYFFRSQWLQTWSQSLKINFVMEYTKIII